MDRPIAHRAIALAEAQLRAVRSAIYEQAVHFWKKSIANESISDVERAIAHAIASDSANRLVEIVERLLEAAGTSANPKGAALERIARDIRVIRQHATVSPHHLYDAGKVILGLEPRGILSR